MEPAAQFLEVVLEFPGERGRRRVLDGFTLSVERGRICGVMGANGSGKSTALRALAGLNEPASGECRVFGVPSRLAEARRRLGFLPELPVFPPAVTARELLETLARLETDRPMERRRRVETALEASGAAEVADRRLGRLSQGQRARVGLAQAILEEPDLLVLDEPTNGLDAEGLDRLGSVLRAWRRAGRSVLIAAHDSGQLESWCDEVALVQAGRIAEVRRRPSLDAASARVRGLDAARMGRLAAWVAAEGGTCETGRADEGWIDGVAAKGGDPGLGGRSRCFSGRTSGEVR